MEAGERQACVHTGAAAGCSEGEGWAQTATEVRTNDLAGVGVAVAGGDVHGACSLPHLKLKRFRVIGLAGVCIERVDVGNES